MQPRYQPPGFQVPLGPLNDRVKYWMEYWDKFFNYTRNFLNRVDANTVVSIVAAATIEPTRVIQPVTGSTTITTISVPIDFGGVLTLLAINGFSVATGGNIARAKTMAAGEAVTLYFNILSDTWFVST